MRQLNEAVYTQIYKTISEAADIKNARRYGTADINGEIEGAFSLAVSDAYDAHEWKADRYYNITDLEDFTQAVEDYDINVTAEQWKAIKADPADYYKEYTELGKILSEVEEVSSCIRLEYSYTHELDGYGISIVSNEYDTFIQLYDTENKNQFDYFEECGGVDQEDLTEALLNYFDKEIIQASEDYFNNEVLPEFSDAVKKVYKAEFKYFHNDDLEDRIADLITVEDDLSYYLEDDVDQATLINFKRQIKDLQKTAPTDWESLKREHKNKSGDCVTIQFMDALAKACKDLGVNYDDYTDNDLHDDYEATEWLSEYIEQEEARNAN